MEGHTDLHVIAIVTLSTVRYQDEILRLIVRPYAGAVGPGFLHAGQCLASRGQSV